MRRWSIGEGARWIGGALLLAAVTWPIVVTPPRGSLDPSWRAGLSMAFRDGLHFGTDVIFTYGPWGFAMEPQLYDTTAYRIAVLVNLVLWAAAALAVWVAVSRTWGRGWAWPVSAIVLCSALYVEAAVVASTAVAVLLVQWTDRRLPSWIPVVLGLAAGFLLLGKQSTGAQIAVVLALALALRPGPRVLHVGLYAAATAVSWLACWTLAGQQIGDIPEFLRGSLEIIVGYGPAMSLADPTLRVGYWAALALAVVVGMGVRAATRATPAVSSTGLALVSAFVVFASFKQGFVRNDIGHATLFFGGMVVLMAALPWGRDRRVQAGLAITLAACSFFTLTRIDPANVVNPIGAPQELAKTVRLTFRAAERDRMIAEGRAKMLEAFALRPSVFREIRDRTVHVVPWEITVAWAYKLRWNPLPVFQDYSAYTSYLDDANADRLASPKGPERVLQGRPAAIDGRVPAWEPPRQWVELLCRYRPVAEQRAWRVLARDTDRCGAERPLLTVKAGWGETVPVPVAPAGTLLTLSVDGLEPHGLETLRSLAWKPAERYARLDRTRLQRVIPATAGDGLLLSAPASIDPPGRFRMSPAPRTISFWRGPGTDSQAGGELTLRFDVRPVAAPAAR